ncbi:hypothetical protein SDC9_18868 [bioreactor metagenome]|uniref:Uncharacterized protein n=1 Tax=bioreactor metagenome TaxID=1076179 RepID=A0A644U1F4_9ZZZZ
MPAPGRGGSLRADHHHHLPALELRHAFDLAGLADIGGDAVQQFEAKALVRHFAAAEAQGDLHLVAILEEAHHRAHLDLVVMGVGPGAELHFLDFDDLLLLAGFGLALLLFVLELAVVHDLAHRRHRRRRDLDQIKPGLFGHHHRARRGDDAHVLAVRPDQADLGRSDPIVDPGAGVSLRRGIVRSAGYGCDPSAAKSNGAQNRTHSRGFQPESAVFRPIGLVRGKESALKPLPRRRGCPYSRRRIRFRTEGRET